MSEERRKVLAEFSSEEKALVIRESNVVQQARITLSLCEKGANATLHALASKYELPTEFQIDLGLGVAWIPEEKEEENG